MTVRDTISNDLKTSLLLFLLSVAWAAGISLISGLSLYSAVISTIVGATIVLWISKSTASITGPSASLAAPIFVAVNHNSSNETIFLSIIACGIIQLLMGIFRAGSI